MNTTTKLLKDSIDKNSYEVLLLKKQLENETDPSSRPKISERIEILERQIQDFKQQIQSGRVAMGARLNVSLLVH